MSEEQILEALGQEVEEEITEDTVIEETAEVEELPELSPVEQKAWDQGWRPEDKFEGNPDNWKSAESYVLYGEMQKQIHDIKADARRKETETEERIANLNKLHEAQQKTAIEALKKQQREAVYNADTEEFDRLQGQIDTAESTAVVKPAVAAPAVDPAVAAWEAKNDWINDPGSEKTQQAQAMWAIAAGKPGATNESALSYVDDQLAKLYPEHKPVAGNPRREAPTMTEQGRRPSARRGKELSMNDLTSAERNDWDMFGSDMYKTEKDFLKAVADSRKV